MSVEYRNVSAGGVHVAVEIVEIENGFLVIEPVFDFGRRPGKVYYEPETGDVALRVERMVEAAMNAAAAAQQENTAA